MVMMQGRVAVEYDAATATLLSTAGVTQSEIGRNLNTAIAVDALDAAYWDNNEVPFGWAAVNIHITASVQNAGTDDFDFKLEAYSSADFSSERTQIGSLKFEGAPVAGFYRFAVDAKTAKALMATMTHICLVLDLTHASDSVTYTAWLSPLKAS